MFFILILLKVWNYMKNDNKQFSVLYNKKKHGFNYIFSAYFETNKTVLVVL